MNIESLSAAQLRKAAVIKDQITSLQIQLAQLLGSSNNGVGSRPKPAGQARRVMSAAAKAALSKKLKAIWAKRKAAAKK